MVNKVFSVNEKPTLKDDECTCECEKQKNYKLLQFIYKIIRVSWLNFV